MNRLSVVLLALALALSLSTPSLARHSFPGRVYFVDPRDNSTIGPFECNCTYYGIDKQVYIQIPRISKSFWTSVIDRERRSGDTYWTVEDRGGDTWIIVED